MKRFTKTMAVLLAVAMSLVAVHAAFAAETVTGTITDLKHRGAMGRDRR